MLLLSQNSIDKLSLIDPPGWITHFIPSFFANSTQSGNGKNASDAITASFKSNLKNLAFLTACFKASTLEVCPTPLANSCLFFANTMQPDVDLNPIYQDIYPFSKIVGNANILIMPALHSAAISTKLMKVFGGGKLIGPLLIGLGWPIEVAPLRSTTSDILNLASIAAYSADVINYDKN